MTRPALRCWLLLVLVACGGSDGGDTPTGPSAWLGFEDAVPYPLGGTGATSLVARDATGDGLLDLVAVSRGDAVRVLPGVAGGRFGTAVAYLAGSDPLRAVTGDVDGDGRQDIIAIGHFDNAFQVRRGEGGGTFASAVGYPVRNHGRQLAVVDLNGDHMDDVVAVHDGSGQPIWITVFAGAATGALRPIWEASTPYLASKRVVVGDFDGDGRTDVAIGMGDARASVLLLRGLGNGLFETPLALPTAQGAPGSTDGTESIAAGDLDGNGRTDLVSAHFDPPGLSVRLSGAAGVGAPRLLTAPASTDVALGDVDGDGRLDAVMAQAESETIGVFPGQADGSFGAARQFAAGPLPSHVVLADFDRDGRLDVAVGSATDGHLRVLRNRGDGTR